MFDPISWGVAAGFIFKPIIEELATDATKDWVKDIKIEYAVGIRSNHGVWLPKGQRVRANRWRAYKNITYNGKYDLWFIVGMTFSGLLPRVTEES